MYGNGTGMFMLLEEETRSIVRDAFKFLLFFVTMFVTAVTLQESSLNAMDPGSEADPVKIGIHNRYRPLVYPLTWATPVPDAG